LRRTGMGVVNMKIGILGGTFDPVHNGHLKIAGEIMHTLGLDWVIFIPVGQSPFKAAYTVTPAEPRLEMLRLAVADNPEYVISTIEVERPGISYTVDTLQELKHQYQPDDELYFIIGWDSLERFTEWRGTDRIIEMCSLVAVPRPGWEKPDLEQLENDVPGISSRVIFTDGPVIDISSSAVRDMVSRGEAIDGLVPGSVAEYIMKQKLYRE